MCGFCSEYKIQKLKNSIIVGESKYYSASLVVHTIIDDENRMFRSYYTHFMDGEEGFKLNFCPECGKKLLED